MARTIHVGFAVNAEEKDMLDLLAEKEERTASQIMRRALLDYYSKNK